ncbi:MAG: hypothetical protein DLM71_07275 [Chloroflexi bacterium]|nr:MAG: hypothetical protein DLM71_07275 [Chloroflexota bacterium]
MVTDAETALTDDRRARRVTVIGDALLDVLVRPSSAGSVGTDSPAQISVGPGGQGANVAVGLARRGLPVRLVAATGTDAGGRLLRDLLSVEGVDLVTPPDGGPPTGCVVVLLDAQGERTMLSQRPPSAAPQPAELGYGTAWVHVSGYALLDPSGGSDLAAALGARPPDVRCSIAGGSIRDDVTVTHRALDLIGRACPQLLVVSRDEAVALVRGTAPAARSVPELAASLGGQLAERVTAAHTLVVITDGPRGAAAAWPGGCLEVASAARRAVDATGAGDAYVAALLAELVRRSASWPPTDTELRAAMRLAAEAGAAAVEVVGAQGRVHEAHPDERSPSG